MGLLDGDIKSIAHNALKGILLDMSLAKKTTTPAVNAWEAPTISSTSYSVKGAVMQYKDHLIDGTIIQRGDEKMLILAGSYTGDAPVSGDTVTFNSIVYHIINVVTDPATATYEMQVRKAV